MEEDIDTILERRTKSLIVDFSDKISGVVGRSSFSKTVFKSKRSIDSTTYEGHSHDDIDVDDPDFWKKILGYSLTEENDDFISIKRARQPVDYGGQIYMSDASVIGNLTDDDYSL
jgi:hypothetical protein